MKAKMSAGTGPAVHSTLNPTLSLVVFIERRTEPLRQEVQRRLSSLLPQYWQRSFLDGSGLVHPAQGGQPFAKRYRRGRLTACLGYSSPFWCWAKGRIGSRSNHRR